jgi:hypothetical protein
MGDISKGVANTLVRQEIYKKDILRVHTACCEKTPCTSILLLVIKTTCTSILLMDVHTTSGGQEYTLHVHTRLLLVLNLLYHVDKVNAGMPREKGSPPLAFLPVVNCVSPDSTFLTSHSASRFFVWQL